MGRKAGQPLVDQDLVMAMRHPTRMHALIVLNERTMFASDIADEVDRSVRHVEYHLEKLEEVGAIEEVGEQPGYNGKPQMTYRAVVRPWIHTEDWAQVDADAQAGPTGAIFDNMNQDLRKAIVGGTINELGNHISRTPLILEDESFAEVVRLLDATLDQLLKIQATAAGRLAAGAEPVPAKVHMIQFISPEPKGKD